jgi:serine/threonine protein kinase
MFTLTSTPRAAPRCDNCKIHIQSSCSKTWSAAHSAVHSHSIDPLQHRDVKAANILFDVHGTAKVRSNFGFCARPARKLISVRTFP